MDKDEGLTKLWIEKHAALPDKVTTGGAAPRTKKFKTDKHTVEIIKTFSKKNKIEWNVFIQAAWGLLLNRLSTSDFVVFGTSTLVNSRSNYLNIQSPIDPIKSHLNVDISIKRFITKIKSQINKKTKHKTTIDDELRYLILFKSTSKKNKVDRITVERFPLILLAETKNPSLLSIHCNSSLFTENDITYIYNHLIVIITEMCRSTSHKAATLNILTKDESKKILGKWARPECEFSVPELSLCVHDLFSKYAEKNPSHIAVSHNDMNTTYKEMDDNASRLASMLIKNGIKTGDRICVLMERTPLLLITMIAIFKCGAIYVPINPKYPDERIEFIINDSEAKIILVSYLEKLSGNHQQMAKTITHTLLSSLSPEETYCLPSISPSNIAYIIYTSGTTGQPKGVMIKHESLINFVAWYQACFHVTNQDRASQFASQGFDTHLCETIPFFALGASIHIVDDNIKLTPALFLDWLKKEKISVLDLPTSYAFMLFSLRWPDNINVRLLKIGGESMSRYPEQYFNFDIWNIYGPTEATIEAIYMKVHSVTSHSDFKKKTVPPIGKPMANSEVYVVDKYMQPVPIGVAGELLIGGINVSAGYLNRNDLTAEKFIPNIFNPDSTHKLYKTGDLVSWLPDGNIEFIGRIDHQVKIRGYRVELGDIENAIAQHPDVNEAIVLVREGVSKEKSLIAYIVPNLEKERFLYQERCLLSLDNKTFIECITEDISKYGAAISGISERIQPGKKATIHIKLPGFNESKSFICYVVWQIENRCGISFELSSEDNELVSKSIDYYLSTHNMMELLLSSSAKRSLRKALKKKLPDYMVPLTFVKIMHFPLTLSGKIDVKALQPPHENEHILDRQFISPSTQTEKKLAMMWSDLLHKPDISMSDNFFDIGGNSLTAAELTMKILTEFNISIPFKILFDLSYIPIMAEYIDTKGLSYSNESEIQETILSDAELHNNIHPTGKITPRVKSPENILLTGAGGFLGIYLLRELLQTSQAKIYCLIRKGDFETAAKRLIATIDKFNLTNEISLSDRRIIAIASDISFHNFGLPLEQYNSLASKVDLIYHCGAQVNIMAAYNKMRGSNVIGTLEVIKFATHQIDKPIHYISTLSSAYMKDEAGSLTEEFPIKTYGDLLGGYAISKWVSERLLTEIKNRGLPISIYRSGYIFGQSDNGIGSLNDALLLLIKGCIQMGFAPDMKEKITILPVNFVSKAIVQISLLSPDDSAVYHIDHPTGIFWPDLIAWLNEYGYHINLISIKDWKEKLTHIPKDNAIYPFLPNYLTMNDNHHSPDVVIDRANSALQDIGLTYPVIDDKLLAMYFNYFCQEKFLPMPHKSSKTSTEKM